MSWQLVLWCFGAWCVGWYSHRWATKPRATGIVCAACPHARTDLEEKISPERVRKEIEQIRQTLTMTQA